MPAIFLLQVQRLSERPCVASGHRKPHGVHFPQAFEDVVKQVAFIRKDWMGRGRSVGILEDESYSTMEDNFKDYVRMRGV